MNIGILTFHAPHNFGSMLQAYALQRYLTNQGLNVVILNLRTNRQMRLYKHPLSPVLPLRRSVLYDNLLSLFNPVWLYRECRKWNVYEDFLKNNLRLTKRYKNWEELKKDIPLLNLDCIITGGDQIWNLRCKDFDTSYFLTGELGGVRKISYSPSFGGKLLSSITEKETELIIKNLMDYDYISVREDSMQLFLSKHFNKEVEVVVDPTLLLEAQDYDALIDEEPLIKGEYIYYYSPIYRPYAEKLAKMMGESLGLKVVTSFPHVFRNDGLVGFQESGPIEFLNLLKNSTFVVGRSFHSVIFSLLYHKNFIAIDGARDNRMNNILSLLGIPERGMVTEGNYKDFILPEIDFEKTDGIIRDQRNKSVLFLKKALKNDKN